MQLYPCWEMGTQLLSGPNTCACRGSISVLSRFSYWYSYLSILLPKHLSQVEQPVQSNPCAPTISGGELGSLQDLHMKQEIQPAQAARYSYKLCLFAISNGQILLATELRNRLFLCCSYLWLLCMISETRVRYTSSFQTRKKIFFFLNKVFFKCTL